MVICAVINCGARSGRDGLRMFCVPSVISHQCERTRDLTTKRRLLWLSRIKRADIPFQKPSKDLVVCSKHFVKGQPSKVWEDTDPDWAPSICLGYDCPLKPTESTVQRHGRAQARAIKRRIQEDTAASVPSKRAPSPDAMEGLQSTVDACESGIVKSISCLSVSCQTDFIGVQSVSCQTDFIGARSVSCQTDFSSAQSVSSQTDCTSSDLLELQDQLERTTQDNFALRTELTKLRHQVRASSMEKSDLEGDDFKVKFYTGLPTFLVLLNLFQFVETKVAQTHRNKLSKFQEFVMVLMRLRLNLLEQDLAFRFGVSQPTVSNICDKWIRIMSHRLEKLIKWPEREILRATMPACFTEAFGKTVAVIIDCFEVFTERPSSLLTRAETWSQYKRHNTVKFLIGITPQGTVSFISRGWVGRASDKCITERCGILNKLLPGDVVLADRGFDIADVLALVRAKLHIPDFTKSKSQLTAEEVQGTRKIANVRIHVERVIGLVRRKYRILEGTLPVESLRVRAGDTEAQIDHIVKLCCALTNLSPSVVLNSKEEKSAMSGQNM